MTELVPPQAGISYCHRGEGQEAKWIDLSLKAIGLPKNKQKQNKKQNKIK